MSVSEVEITPNRVLQRTYPWVVIAIAFLTVGIAFGARNAFAVFLVAVIEEFHWSRGLASGALMLGSVMWTLAAPIIGILLDRLGPRIVPRRSDHHGAWFCNQRDGAYHGSLSRHGNFHGCRLCGTADDLCHLLVQLVYSQTRPGDRNGRVRDRFGDTLVVPWTQWLIATYGWRAAFFILAGVLAIVIAPLNYFFQRQRPEEMNLKPDFGDSPARPVAGHARRRPQRSKFKGGAANLAILGFAFGVLAMILLHMVLIHQVAAVSDAGFSENWRHLDWD